MIFLAVGLAIFVLTHSLKWVAPQWRDHWQSTLGLARYRGVFSLVSLVSVAAIVLGFSQARYDHLLWSPPPALHYLNWALMLFACVAMAASFTRSHLRRAIKHPQLTAIKSWSVAHLLVNGHLAAIVLFSVMLAWALITRIGYKRRHEHPAAFEPLLLHDLLGVGAGIWVFALFMLGLHGYVFGVSPLL